MTALELANEMTEKEVNNVLNYWVDMESAKVKEYETLVRMGDSKKIAVATLMLKKDNSSEEYYRAYCA
jgi:hypothetical protein